MAANTLLRVVCGVFFLPHTVLMFVFFNDTLAFFQRAGYRPPLFWLYLDAVAEVVVAPMLIFNIHARVGACMAALLLLTAAISIPIANGWKWRWNRGGPEYPVFWAIMCLIVAYQS